MAMWFCDNCKNLFNLEEANFKIIYRFGINIQKADGKCPHCDHAFELSIDEIPQNIRKNLS